MAFHVSTIARSNDRGKKYKLLAKIINTNYYLLLREKNI